MSISDRLLGKKNVNGHPHIEAVAPSAALPGGEIRILGSGLRPNELRRPHVKFGDVEAPVVISSDDFVVARVPDGAGSGPVIVSTNGHASNAHQVRVAAAIADNLHPVANPALDAEGNIYVTFSGSRGQKVPVAIFKIDTNYNIKPFVVDLMNATSIAFDRAGQMYVSSRYDGAVYRVAPNGTMSSYRRVWEWQPGLHLTAKRICTSATAVAPSSRSAGTGRFLFSPLWSQAFPRITLRSAQKAIFL